MPKLRKSSKHVKRVKRNKSNKSRSNCRSNSRSISISRNVSKPRSIKYRKYRGRGGCNSCISGSTPSEAKVWTSSGGGPSNLEQISDDIYSYHNEPSVYKPFN